MKSKCQSFALIFILIFLFTACNSNHENGDELKPGSKAAVKGTIVCLPKKGDAPVTLECKFGLKVDSVYYGLKNIPRQDIKSGVVRTGNRVKVQGNVVETEANSTYRVAATIDIISMRLIEKEVSKNIFKGSGFRVLIPSNWVRQNSSSQPWSVLSSQTEGKTAAVFRTSESYLAKTNFGYATITVGFSDDTGALKNCIQPMADNERVKTSKVDINGVIFTKISVTDAGAGNRYATDSYRILKNGKCWAVESVLNYSPVEFYGKESGVSEFNRAKTEQMIWNIIQTFKFN